MNDESNARVWSVEVSGQIYEATLDELIQWIGDGALLPADKVRKGNLRAIEAYKVPQLAPYFDSVATAGVQNSRVDALINDRQNGRSDRHAYNEPLTNSAKLSSDSGPGSDCCRRHSDAAASLICATCGSAFCRDCPSSYGGVKICPECGGMCHSRTDVQRASYQQTQFASDLEEGFGFGDLARAITYPFKFKSSLIFGSVMFAFFTFGQSASALGGIFMFSASLTCMMMANMLTFGVLANTVENFSQGNLDSNFMPDFDDFSLWDDVVHPFFLSLGAYVSSFGLFVLVLLVGMYFVVSAMSSKAESIQSDIERIPGTHFYDTQRTVQQSEHVKNVLGDVERQNSERLAQQEEVEKGRDGVTSKQEDTEVSVMEADKIIQQQRKEQLQSIVGKSSTEKNGETAEMVKSFLSLAAPFVVLAAIAFLWGVFYFPVACAVAGYTRSFFATINPIVGLDTIRRLGIGYIKILGMAFLIVFASGFFSMIVSAILSPLDLPGFGNVPARVIISLFTFYFSIVFSCVIGLAMYKYSDRLNLLR